MDLETLVLESPMLYLVSRWLILVVTFLVLTLVFRNRVMLEGFAGYGFVLFILVPINIFAETYLDSMDLSVSEVTAPYIFLTVVLIVNSILLLAFTHILPGISVSNNGMLLFFSLIFSVAAFLLRSFLPSLPASLVSSLR